MFKRILILSLLIFPVVVCAEANKQVPPSVYVHEGQAYPPILFVSNIKNFEFKAKLESYQAFSSVNDDQPGLPIGVRVLNGLRTKGDGKMFSTLMLSAATLGLVPIVSSQTFKVRYDVFVQGDSIAKYEYEMTSTDVTNMWSGVRGSEALKPAEQLFLESSLDKFFQEVKNDNKVQSIFEEYHHYFGAVN